MSEDSIHPDPMSAAYYLDRIRRLSHVVDDVTADRDLALLRAYERGASHQEIARRADLKPAEVEAVVTSLLAEEDIADWYDGPDYLPVYARYH
ncbi:hypothetical protein ACWGIB_27705 [Streptomyces xiamenensis]